MAFLSPDANLAVRYSGSEASDSLYLANNSTSTFDGHVDMTNLGALDLIGLSGLGYAGVVTKTAGNPHGQGCTNPLTFKSDGFGDLVAKVTGGGSVPLHATSTVSAKNFIFSSTTV